MLCAKIFPIEIARIPVWSMCIARPCKIGQWFYVKFEIQTFNTRDPEGETQ